MHLRTIAALTLMLIGFAAATNAADAAKALPLGKGAVTEKGHIKGKEVVDYTLQAHTGQTLKATIETGDTAAYFDLLPPGGGEALFMGARVGQEFSGALPADGVYTLHLHLAGRDAYLGNETDYSLAVSLDGK